MFKNLVPIKLSKAKKRGKNNIDVEEIIEELHLLWYLNLKRSYKFLKNIENFNKKVKTQKKMKNKKNLTSKCEKLMKRMFHQEIIIIKNK